MHLIILIVVITLHLAYEYFIVRKKIEEKDHFLYMALGIFLLIGIWKYAEHLIVDKWELIDSNWHFALWFFFPYALISGLIGGSGRRWNKSKTFYTKQSKNSVIV